MMKSGYFNNEIFLGIFLLRGGFYSLETGILRGLSLIVTYLSDPSSLTESTSKDWVLYGQQQANPEVVLSAADEIGMVPGAR